MRFDLDINGVDPNSEDLKAFHADWCRFAAEENAAVSGERHLVKLSVAQRMLIDVFCGIEHDVPEKVGTIFPAQVELEALFRGRQRALAEAFHRGTLRVELN